MRAADTADDSPSRSRTAESARSRRGGGWFDSMALTGPALIVSAIALGCFVLPWTGVVPSPVGGSVLQANLPLLSPDHPLGTDMNGNDVLSRIVYGGRTSLRIAVAVNLLGLIVGGLLGSVSAYVGGATDNVMMRLLDLLIAFPSLILVVLFSQALGPSEANTVWALALFSVPAFARVARASTVRLREREFIAAAALSGTRPLGILARHVMPNILPQLVVFAFLGMGIAIIVEGALTFLGLGLPPPLPSWGNMIFHGQQALLSNPGLVVIPSAFLFVTVLSFNLLAEALRVRWSRI